MPGSDDGDDEHVGNTDNANAEDADEAYTKPKPPSQPSSVHDTGVASSSNYQAPKSNYEAPKSNYEIKQLNVTQSMVNPSTEQRGLQPSVKFKEPSNSDVHQGVDTEIRNWEVQREVYTPSVYGAQPTSSKPVEQKGTSAAKLYPQSILKKRPEASAAAAAENWTSDDSGMQWSNDLHNDKPSTTADGKVELTISGYHSDQDFSAITEPSAKYPVVSKGNDDDALVLSEPQNTNFGSKISRSFRNVKVKTRNFFRPRSPRPESSARSNKEVSLHFSNQPLEPVKKIVDHFKGLLQSISEQNSKNPTAALTEILGEYEAKFETDQKILNELPLSLDKRETRIMSTNNQVYDRHPKHHQAEAQQDRKQWFSSTKSAQRKKQDDADDAANQVQLLALKCNHLEETLAVKNKIIVDLTNQLHSSEKGRKKLLLQVTKPQRADTTSSSANQGDLHQIPTVSESANENTRLKAEIEKLEKDVEYHKAHSNDLLELSIVVSKSNNQLLQESKKPNEEHYNMGLLKSRDDQIASLNAQANAAVRRETKLEEANRALRTRVHAYRKSKIAVMCKFHRLYKQLRSMETRIKLLEKRSSGLSGYNISKTLNSRLRSLDQTIKQLIEALRQARPSDDMYDQTRYFDRPTLTVHDEPDSSQI